ncbi:MMPL family transporter [Rubritalea sp.]|uniref:MMPL family transporter n=1 Tax=Rubritalea sp. TaxID=2109375 RepID=UPI003EF99BE0
MRLRFETDILEVLPRKIASVSALKSFNKHFAEERQVVVLLHSSEGEVDEDYAADLAEYLREVWPNSEVNFQSPFEEDPQLLASSVARIWSYAEPSQVDELVRKLMDEVRFEKHLSRVKEDIESSFDQELAMTRAYDPMGFLDHPSLESLMKSEMSFVSDNGQYRMLLIRKKAESDVGYKSDKAWIADIRSHVRTWNQESEAELDFALTGGPVFNAEIGSGMEKDMSGTVALTSFLIAALFLFVQRDLKQLLLLSFLLGLTFLITLGIGGWIFGTLNLVSVGFTAILLGLVIDYAVVIIRESAHISQSTESLRKSITPSILWSSVSTALVFGVLVLSTFTGVQQLGALVMIGLLSGALVMLVLTPCFLAKFPVQAASRAMTPPFLSSSKAWATLTVFLLVSIVAFTLKGRPEVSFDLKMVEPESSEAASTFAVITEEFSAWSERNAILLSSAGSVEKLKDQVAEAETELSSLKDAGVIEEQYWPVGLIPSSSSFKHNEERLQALLARQQLLIESAKEAGFSESGLALDHSVLRAFERLYSSSESLLEASAADPLVGTFFDVDDQGVSYFSGRMLLSEKITPENVGEFESLEKSGVSVTGWSMLQTVLLPHVQRDFYVIFIPAALILLTALFVVFRSVGETLISLLVLVTALVGINALVVVTGQSWNFLSGMAIPLVVGAGIDYSIHLIFALRRLNGDLSAVWNGVGKAICFCGCSTAIGFSSLAFASNKMLQSMGVLCSVGVLLTMLLSLLVIPGLWKWSHRRGGNVVEGDGLHEG